MFTPDIEVYSIDEAFLNLAGFDCSLTNYGRRIQQVAKQWTGIPVTVGIARTKTLSKIANKIAKKSAKAHGVLDLTDSPYLDRALKQVPVEDVWGVGIKTTIKLKRAKIKTALDLRNTDINWIQNKFGIIGARTVYELRGICCYSLENNPPAKKSICVSRMFGTPVESIDQLKEAISSYASRAGEKLRQEKSAASVMTVFVTTSRFIENSYFNSCTAEFPVATNDTVELIRCDCRCIERLYRRNYAFKKCGIILNGLISEKQVQTNLFDKVDRAKSRRLMQAVDTINARLKSQLRWAAEGLIQPWLVKFNRRSKSYTTSWAELLEVV